MTVSNWKTKTSIAFQLGCFVAILGAAIVPSQALGVTLTVAEDFETLSAAAPTVVTNSLLIGGSWVNDMPTGLEDSNAKVYANIDGVGPAAHGGNNKLEIKRNGEFDALMGFGNFSTAGPFPQVIAGPGEVVRVEFYLWQANSAGSFAQLGFMSSPESGVFAPQLSTIFDIDNAVYAEPTPFGVTYYTEDAGRLGTGLAVTPEEWEKWTVEYEVGSTVLNLTIDGPTQGSRSFALNNPARDTGLGGALPNVVGWHFTAGDANTLYYVDDFTASIVPEPSALVLSALGVIGLVSLTLRRQR